MTNNSESPNSAKAKHLARNHFPVLGFGVASSSWVLIAILISGVAAPWSASAQMPTTRLSEDFRVVTTIKGSNDTSVVIGHAVGSRDTMRIDVTSQGKQLAGPPGLSGKVGMIVTDSGKAIAYIDHEKKQYVRVRPTEMIQQAQQMGAMKMDFSDTRATVDSLGKGPVILGHPTLHYRVATGMTLSMTAMGQQQVVKVSNSADYYYATDIGGELNPFASLSDADMVTMIGASNKEFTDKMKAIQARLPKRTPLRASSSATVEASGETRVIDSSAEVTSVVWVPADPKAFEIPSSYTAVQLPGMAGSGATPIPPE